MAGTGRHSQVGPRAPTYALVYYKLPADLVHNMWMLQWTNARFEWSKLRRAECEHTEATTDEARRLRAHRRRSDLLASQQITVTAFYRTAKVNEAEIWNLHEQGRPSPLSR
jgi:hypothetical protein